VRQFVIAGAATQSQSQIKLEVDGKIWDALFYDSLHLLQGVSGVLTLPGLHVKCLSRLTRPRTSSALPGLPPRKSCARHCQQMMRCD
jgi:hypothetical protein